MDIHVATLFGCDADGRLRYVREPGDPQPPPRFFMGRSRGRNVWHFRHDLPETLVRDLERLCQSEPAAEDLRRAPESAPAVRRALEAHAPISGEDRGPAYVIPETVPPSTDAVVITRENAHLLEGRAPWLLHLMSLDVDVGPIATVLIEGTPASICHCARLSPWAAEAGVVTVEAMRGRGYATVAVARWAAAVRARGLLPLYSTSWENLASQRVAQKLGMVCYGEDWSIE